jgi:DNA-binding FadR family transcriptional regulator
MTPPKTLQRIGRQLIGDAVYAHLRDLIVSDTQPAGSMLPSERDLAQSIGVNRQAVREALQRLRALGLVDIIHGGGIRVRDWRSSADLSLLPEIVVDAHGQIRAEPALSLVRFRIAVNCDAAREAARLQRPGLAKSLDAAMATAWQLHEGGREVQTLAVIDAYEQVWAAIIAGSGSVAYQLVSNSLRATARAYVSLFPPSRVPNPVPTQRYQETVDAVKSGDVELAGQAAANTLASAVKIFETYTSR